MNILRYGVINRGYEKIIKLNISNRVRVAWATLAFFLIFYTKNLKNCLEYNKSMNLLY